MKTSDLIVVLDEQHQYVTSSSTMEFIDVEETPEPIRLDSLHSILYFGDKLTVERIRGAKAVRCNSENAIDKLEGFIPGWHAKVGFLE